MKIFKAVSVAAFALGAFAGTPQQAAAAENLAVETAHTYIGFTIMRQGLSRVIGRFNKYSGDIVFDEANPGASSVKVKVLTESLDSGFERRDRDLKGPNFFNVQEFPEMNFVSTKIEKTGTNTGRITGNLTLLGVTKPVTLNATFNKKNIHPRNKKLFAGFTADGKIKRSDFGMKFGLRFIADEVNIHLEVLSVKS